MQEREDLTIYRDNLIFKLSPPTHRKGTKDMRIFISLTPYNDRKESFDWANKLLISLNILEVANILHTIKSKSVNVRTEFLHKKKDKENNDITTTLRVAYREEIKKIILTLNSIQQGIFDVALNIEFEAWELTLLETIFNRDIPELRAKID